MDSAVTADNGVVLDDVRIDYIIGKDGKRLTAVDGISFTISPGEMVCVVGPSGCGKSTILSAIAGLIPYKSGKILVRNRPVAGPGRDCAVVFQRPALLPWKTAEANVTYALRLRGLPKAEARERAHSVIQLVGLSAYREMYPYQMSGGMQQRINLARALAVDTEFILLDEPFAALDAQSREVLQQELLNLWESTSKTGLFITHQIEEAVLLGDRVIVMSKGPRAKIAKEIVIDFPHPRDWDIRLTPKYTSYVDGIWQYLKDEQE